MACALAWVGGPELALAHVKWVAGRRGAHVDGGRGMRAVAGPAVCGALLELGDITDTDMCCAPTKLVWCQWVVALLVRIGRAAARATTWCR